MLKNKFRINNPLVVLLHILVWAAMICIPLYFLFREPFGAGIQHLPGHKDATPFVNERKLFSFIKSNILLIFLFYLNEYFLVPDLLKKRGIWAYVLIASVAMVLFTIADNILTALIMEHSEFLDLHFIVIHLLPMVVVLAISSTFWLVSDQRRIEKRQTEMETERLSSELSFLRSQVSPHFMFNVLNSIISLARKKSDLLEPVVIKLSHLLRYMLYESDDHRINLSIETEYLRSYIDLQQMRFGEDVNITFEVDELPETFYIEPMLLIPFVENAFKHGVGLVINPVIEIKIRLSQRSLHFFVKNKYNSHSQETKDPNSGIGLKNVERRLKLLYPGRHALKIREKDNWYMVELDLNEA